MNGISGRRCGLGSRFVTQYRISEAAALLGVSDDTLRRWVEAGTLVAAVD